MSEGYIHGKFCSCGLCGQMAAKDAEIEQLKKQIAANGDDYTIHGLEKKIEQLNAILVCILDQERVGHICIDFDVFTNAQREILAKICDEQAAIEKE